jgi:molybdopterin synthase catalytic subunit/molybdopterin converting factor small subunit
MRVHLLAFASAGDALGAGELELDLPAGATVADLRLVLDRGHPALAPLWPRLAVAVNGVVVGPAAALSEGVEVALLPPVSGGTGDDANPPPTLTAPTAPAPESPASRVELVEGPIDAQKVMARVASPGRGAVLLFLGTVRDRAQASPPGGAPPQGAVPLADPAPVPSRPVLHLTYSAYRPMALARLALIACELEEAAEAAGGNLRVAIVHRLGQVALGEASVAIAVAAPHRAAAYEASRRALERLKSEVPIWKLERYADGEAVWREEEPLPGRS